MSKLFCLATFACFAFCAPVEAKTYNMVAQSLTQISTTKAMPEYITLRVPAQTITSANIVLENDALVRARVTRVQPARRGKLNGYLEGVLIAYSIPSLENKAVDVSAKGIEVKLKKYSKTDFKEIAQSAATTVVSHVFEVPFLTQGVAAVKGAVKPIEGESRLKSAGIKVYESTPLVYLNRGQELEIPVGEKLTLSVKVDRPDEDDAN